MRTLVTLLALVAALVITAAVVFFAVVVLVGPHGGTWHESLRNLVPALGWFLVLALPLLVARRTWRRQSP